jgi:hypothetical protein
MAKPFSKKQQEVLRVLHSGRRRLYSAGGFTFFEGDSRDTVPTPTLNALKNAGLVEVDVFPFYCISKAGVAKLKELQEAA